MGGERRLFKKRPSGISLTEMMISAAILSLGVLAAIGSYTYISTSIQHSKSRTLSNNLGQEQIEKLKNLQYYTLLVTTSIYSDNRFTPPLTYDTVNYPAQTLIVGSIPFVRATRVDFAYSSGTVITTAPWTSADTGVKKITVYVIWQEGSTLQYKELDNLMANPAANPLNATFSGNVKNASGNNLQGALVQVVGYPNWYAISNASGNYSFNVSQGSYTLQCSTVGYFTQTTNGYQSITSGQVLTVNFTLQAMSTGTATGYIYRDDHLVISAVVASTGPSNGIEYIELYNPTTSPINIGSNPTYTTPNIWPILWDSSDGLNQQRHLIYLSTYVASNGYYLISNTSATPTTCNSFTIAGVTRPPDACWYYLAAPYHAIQCGDGCTSGGVNPMPNDSGGVSIANASGYIAATWPATRIDSVGWAKNGGHSAPSGAVEGTQIMTSAGWGLQTGEILIRWTDPGNVNSSFGRAYDSNDNSHDFWRTMPIPAAPNSASQGTAPPLTGTPATGANVNFNDPLSGLTTCNDTTLSGGYRVCAFTTVGIATGTWTAVITSGTYYTTISTITILANVSTGVPNGSTAPNWTTVNNSTLTLLNDTTIYAFVSGQVNDANGSPLNYITVSGGIQNVHTNSSGNYFLSASTGNVQIIANSANANRAYTSASQTLTSLQAGTLYANTNFTLIYGGIIQGYFQTGSATPLPSRVAVALQGGSQQAQAVSDNTGYFYLANLATGTYTVQPSLDPAETSSPSSSTVILTTTGTYTVISTFTITNALGQITGQVTNNSQPITTGILVLASTSSLGGSSTSLPPSLNGGAGQLCNPCYYTGSSDASGNYTLQVRSSASAYNLYGWYTTFSGSTPSFTRKGPYSITISTGQIQTQNISWP